jgi:hypothetical protein
VTVNVMGKLPVVVGVPLRVPSGPTAKPPIGADDAAHTSGASPSLAENAKLYDEPTIAVGGCVLLIVGATGSLIAIEYATEFVAGVGELLSVTVTVNANGVKLAVVGVPLSVPSAESVRPGGNVPAVTAQLSGK